MFGGVEAGGTKFVCVIGTGPGEIVETLRLAATSPDETLDATIDFFRRAIAKGRRLDAIGIGSFGPVELRPGHPQYGSITTTPKSGWSGTPLVGPFVAAFGVPVGFDTDVNAAALAEGRWGAARGLKSFVYLTLGTGIGGGAVIDGQILHGLGHSEMGHLAVPRHPDDAFEGVCPFHGDCLEGMASGPAVAARYGRRAEHLEGDERRAAAELRRLLRRRRHPLDRLRARAGADRHRRRPVRVAGSGGGGASRARPRARRLPRPAEHDQPDFISLALLGGQAGPVGTLILAERALARPVLGS